MQLDFIWKLENYLIKILRIQMKRGLKLSDSKGSRESPDKPKPVN